MRIRMLVAAPAAALLAYGAVGVLALGTIVPSLRATLGSWAGVMAARDLSWSWPGPRQLIPFEGYFATRPWLPWLALVMGAVLLAWSLGLDSDEAGRSAGSRGTRANRLRARRATLFTAFGLLAVIGIAAYLRIDHMTPQDKALVFRPYEDEGVYVLAAQLVRQGALPYRDFFFAHPPLGALAFLPAISYHFTEWGSPTSFVMARYFSLACGLATVVMIFLICRRLGNNAAGLAAALVYGVDGIAIQVGQKALLDPPMILLAAIALLLYLEARARQGNTMLLLAAAGVAGLAFMTKVTAVVVILAFLADLLLSRRGKEALRVLAAFLVTCLVVSAYFLIKAPGEYISQVFLFQLARPGDGIVTAIDRARDMASSGGSFLTIAAGALGAVAIAISVATGRLRSWTVVLMLGFLTVFMLTSSRSYYSHYFSLLAFPLSLLAGGLVAAATRSGLAWPVALTRGKVTPVIAGVICVLLVAPVLAAQVRWVTAPSEDKIYAVVGKYLNYNMPPAATVLAMDSQFSFLAARSPSRGPDGTYLVDSYGYMIYTALGMKAGGLGAFLDAVRNPKSSEDVWSTMLAPVAQKDILDRIASADFFVMDAKSWNRLSPDTRQSLAEHGELMIEQSRYAIYRIKKGG